MNGPAPTLRRHWLSTVRLNSTRSGRYQPQRTAATNLNELLNFVNHLPFSLQPELDAIRTLLAFILPSRVLAVSKVNLSRRLTPTGFSLVFAPHGGP
jgi:hypothetical protein